MSINLLVMLGAIGLSILATQRDKPQLRMVGFGLLVLLLVAAPFLSNNKAVLTDMYILGIAGVGWNVIGGFTGYAAFGQVAFWGLGAYALAVFGLEATPAQATLGWSIPVGFLMAALIPALVAALIGLPVLRLKGHYFAIATLGVGIAIREIFRNVDCIGDRLVCLGGATGLAFPVVKKADRDLNSMLQYFLTLLVFAASVGITFYLSRSKFGYGLFAIRENEDAAAVMGINTTWFKIGAFSLAAAMTGLAGAWRGLVNGQIEPGESSIFDPNISLYVIIICLLGGVGTVWGPFIGAIIYAALQEFLTSMQNVAGFGWLLEWKNVIFGAIVVLLVLFLPKGILQLVRNKGGFSWRIFTRNMRENSI